VDGAGAILDVPAERVDFEFEADFEEDVFAEDFAEFFEVRFFVL
jgi:hypothetical protein